MAKATKSLGVWMDDDKIATLSQRRWPEISLRYTDEATDRWRQNSPVISCSLPLMAQPQDALAFCRGLLPEGQALQTFAQQAGLAVNDTFGLLSRYGRDVAGALTISEDPPDVGRFGVQPVSANDLEAAIEEMDEYPLGAHDDSELSLAGLQDKILLVKLNGGEWGRPLHGRPSSHILKVDDRARIGLVRAESECLTLARDLGLTTIEHELIKVGDLECLVLSRFDRRTSGADIARVHQEDACQALGIDPEANRGRAKYEREGGPTLKAIASLLDQWADAPELELDRLTACVTFNVAIGNADAHGKNVALLHPTPQRVELAPLYDTVPTALWPKLRTDGAMSVDGQKSLPKVTFEDIVNEAVSWDHPRNRAMDAARRTLDGLLAGVERAAIPAESDVSNFVRSRSLELLSGA